MPRPQHPIEYKLPSGSIRCLLPVPFADNLALVFEHVDDAKDILALQHGDKRASDFDGEPETDTA